MNNLKVDTRSRESNSGHYDCEARPLPHDNAHQSENEICDFRNDNTE